MYRGDGPLTIEEVIARAQITDVIYRYCRGLDRMDKALTLSCWHLGGTDDHGRMFCGTAADFVEWVWPVHERMIATRHMITNIQIEFHGADRAGSESYASLILRVPKDGGVYDCYFQSRYVDRFERIDGVWRIRHRIQVRDSARYVAVGSEDEPPAGGPLIALSNPDGVAQQSTRDGHDPSFAALYAL